MSFSLARERPAIRIVFDAGSRPSVRWPAVSATAFTASKSPFDAIGKPASHTSTPRRESDFAIETFSSPVIVAPGLCSPSRSVVSKTTRRSRSADADENARGPVRRSGAAARRVALSSEVATIAEIAREPTT